MPGAALSLPPLSVPTLQSSLSIPWLKKGTQIFQQGESLVALYKARPFISPETFVDSHPCRQAGNMSNMALHP